MSLSSILSLLALLPKLFTLVDAAVQSVETSLVGVAGSTKFTAAEAKVNSVLTAAGTDASVLASASGVVGVLINSSVAAFNAAGIFSKPAAAPAPTVAQ